MSPASRLPEVLLQHPRLPQQPQRNAHAGGRQRRARRDAIGHQGPAEHHREQRAHHQGQDGAQEGHTDRRGPHDLRLLEVEVHAALEDHEAHARVANQGKEVGEGAAVRVHVLAGGRWVRIGNGLETMI